ncbi:MAG: hypothetical protein ACYC2T_13495 [Bacillota bacterium]
MKLGIVIETKEAEKAWNALRFGVASPTVAAPEQENAEEGALAPPDENITGENASPEGEPGLEPPTVRR